MRTDECHPQIAPTSRRSGAAAKDVDPQISQIHTDFRIGVSLICESVDKLLVSLKSLHRAKIGTDCAADDSVAWKGERA